MITWLQQLLITILLILGIQHPIKAQCTEATEQEWKDFFNDNTLTFDPIEGMWVSKCSTSIDFVDGSAYNDVSQEKFIIRKYLDGYLECFISKGRTVRYPNLSTINGKTFQSVTTYKKTAAEGGYVRTVTRIINGATVDEEISIALLRGSVLEYSAKTPINIGTHGTNCGYLKILPADVGKVSRQPASGTGFAISSDGYIVTNCHVIDGGKNIYIRGINNNFEQRYRGKVIALDPSHDLAIIRVEDRKFTTLGKVPYIFRKSVVDVGNKVYVLGYPLRGSMGEEVKLTDGIVSAGTGYKGDVTSYQISAPAQPGNSGGPVFDNKGNIIAIVSARHEGAENVTYAIKSRYLLNLLESLQLLNKVNTTSQTVAPAITETVKRIKPLIYIIEIEG